MENINKNLLEEDLKNKNTIKQNATQKTLEKQIKNICVVKEEATPNLLKQTSTQNDLQKETQEDLQKTTTQNKTEENLQNAKTTNQKNNNTQKLTFLISLICGFIVVVQLVLNYFSIQFETKIIIEIVSFILAFLASMGVLGSSLKNKNITQIKENIENTISSKIDNLSNKLDKSDKTK